MASPGNSTDLLSSSQTAEDARSSSSAEVHPSPFVRQPGHPLAVRILFGPDGLRAGWRLLIYIVLVFIIGFAISRFMRLAHLHIPRVMSAWTTAISDGIAFAVVLIASLVMGAFERRSIAAYGLPLRAAFGARFWEGIVWGFAALTLLLVSIRESGDFYFGQVALHGTRLLYFAGAWGVAFLLVGLAEEYSLRGYPQFTLTDGIGFWPAALLLSILFAALHTSNPGETPIGILDVAAIALFFCLTLRRTGNLWFAIGFHASWDWGETFFYGVPNSGMVPTGHLFSPIFHGSRWITGGSAGPEGSVFSLLVTVLVSVLFAFRFRENRYQIVKTTDMQRRDTGTITTRASTEN